jgi:hypothetical protein
VLRALLVALDQWVTEGTEPPASRVPTLATGTLVPPSELKFPALPNVCPPQATNNIAVLDDWVNPPRQPTRTYTALVPQVGADGNEVAGILLPAIAVPRATHTGWNLYRTPELASELYDREGIWLPFARTQAERQAKGDPRPSLAERYGTHAAYVKQVNDVVQDLLCARLLLPEDAARFIDEATQQNPFAP